VFAQSREGAIQKMSSALEEFTVTGIKTTIPFHRQVMKNETFMSGKFDTRFLESFVFEPEN
jgi:acetyl-CoA carboxylase biotin carboxylase subunit